MMQLTWSRLLSVSLLIAALTLETAASRDSHRGANNNRYRIFRKHHRSVARDEDVLPSGRIVTQNYWNSLKGQSTNSSCEEMTETIPVVVDLNPGSHNVYYDDYDYSTTPVRATTFTEPETKATTTPASATSTTPAPAHNPVIIGFYDNYEYDDDDYDSTNDNYSSYSDDVDDNDEDDVSENDDDDLTAVNSKQRGFGNGHENSVSPESDNANVGKAARQQSLSDYQRRRNRQRRRRIQRRRVPARRRRRRNQRRRPQRLRLRRRPNRIRQQVVVRRRRTRTGGRPSTSVPSIPLPNFIRLPAKK